MGRLNGIVRRSVRDLRFLEWDVRVRATMADDAIVERVRSQCPELPDLSDRPDATVGFAPSLVLGALLRIALPVYVAIDTRDLAAIGVSFVLGRVAFRVADRVLLRHVDGRQRRMWHESDLRRMRLAARAQATASRTSTVALRGAKVAFSLGAGLGLATFAAGICGAGGTSATAAIAAFATLALLLCCLLVVLMLAAMVCEELVPTVAGPPGRGTYLISRSDVDAFRPLLNTGPVRLIRDIWDVFRTVRP